MAPLPPPPPPPPRLPAAVGPGVDAGHFVRGEYDHFRSRWGLGEAVLALVVFFVASIAIGLVAFGQSDGLGLDGAWLPIAIVGPAIFELGYVVWVARAQGTGVMADFRIRATLSDLGIGAGLCITGLVLAGITASITMSIFDEEPTATAAEVVEDSGAGSGVTLWIVLFAVLASVFTPFVEEVVFRGLWWSALEKRGMHPVLVLVTTSAVFAVIHLEPLRTPVLFVLGMAIGLGRLATGRVGASIAAHVYVNSIAMTFLLIDLSNSSGS